MSKQERYIIGVDIGTGSTKVIAVMPGGKMPAVHQQSYQTHRPQEGYSEQDPEELLQAVVAGVRTVVAQMKYAPAGISFSAAMHSVMAVDEDGSPLTPLIIWADNRSQAVADVLKGTAQGRQLYERTGVPVHPMSPLCKIVWMREQAPQVFARAAKYVGIKSYLFFRFFGIYVTDYSVASASGLLDIYTLQWSVPAMAVAGISVDQLPKPVSPDHILKGLGDDMAEAMGIPADTPFIAGGSDGCLAQLGSQAMEPGHATLTIGSSGAVRMVNFKAATDDSGRLFTYVLMPEQYITGGAINNGGVVLQWFIKQFMQQGEEGGSMAECIDRALAVPAGAEGLLCLPYMLGERAPVWDGHARGAFVGVQLHHTPAHFLRAMLEGIAFSLLTITEGLEETVCPVTHISVSGGFTASPGWVQLLADIFQQSMALQQQRDASATGAAILAYQALGMDYHPEQTGPATVFAPDIRHSAVYRERYQEYKQLYGRLEGLF
ncbi:gluconokinase [Chitinophaga pendula]|uniref:gluconokinase n=1 Tax=Chitinophaga TaxID=79328 RepID=UPI000BB0B996|nr:MULTISPECIES: gluconokinase [Chitinophaga]ASZ10427.1 gluconate kinase [Chitinophaga sp. MD30]UCJ06605.1 gluconokinase [Chitinophaga pendula]